MTMFEQPSGKEEKDRSRSIMILSGMAVVVVIVLIVLVSSFSKKPTPIAMAHAGSPEFDDYARFVTIGNIDLHHGITGFNNRFGRIICTVHNEGDRLIEGLQIRAYAVGFNGEVFKEKFVNAVPNNAERLEPGQSLKLDIHLEPIPDPATIQDMKVEVAALKLK
jgi:hypothetical protein